MRLDWRIVALTLCLVTSMGACRRNLPSLVDRNQPPNTIIWSAPPDSSEHEYLVHLYWRGEDNDGVVERYLWTIQDTLNTTITSWNPVLRLRDFRSGRVITRSDSIFAFKAFRNISGVGVKRNRQAFYIASIDDNGAIDPSPAAFEFIATIDRLPELRFHLDKGAGLKPYVHVAVPEDTVAMFAPFAISYSGSTVNGNLLAYYWFPLGISSEFAGTHEWNPDLGDTIRYFTNAGAQKLPAAVFRVAAKCMDSAGAESVIDPVSSTRGVAQVVVNFDPDTRIRRVTNNYGSLDSGSNPIRLERDIDFSDSEPDTVAYGSWVRLYYSGWDDRRDGKVCADPTVNRDQCIKFQLRYVREAAHIPRSFSHSGWLPRGQVHDTDSTSAADSNSVNIGSLEYDFYVRSIDENGTSDGTPAQVHVIGNYAPVLDGVALEDHLGHSVDVSGTVVDTLTWNFWKGVGWPYTSALDTVNVRDFKFKKTFEWRLSAWGHDDPRDPPGSSVRSWQYFVRDQTGKFWALGRSGETWFDGGSASFMGDTLRAIFRYGRYPGVDARGDSVFAHLPAYFNRDLTIYRLKGRDIGVDEGYFDQYVFYGVPPDGKKASHGVAAKKLINSFPAPTFGRWTRERSFTFHFRMVR